MPQQFLSSSLFHFTKEMEVFKLILANGIRLSYSYESLTEVEGYLIPMICFCDIPINCLHNHKHIYGKLGIGISKDYLRKDAKFSNLLNPLLYGSSKEIHSAVLNFRASYEYLLQQSTTLSMDYTHLLMTGEGDSNLPQNLDLAFNLMSDTRLLIGYYKPYEDSNNTYYPEREWRIIAPYGISDMPWVHLESRPSDKDRGTLSNKTFNNKEKAYLTIPLYDFQYIDIIVVNSLKKKNELIDFIKTTPRLLGNILTENDIQYRNLLIEKITLKY